CHTYPLLSFFIVRLAPCTTRFPYTTLFRSRGACAITAGVIIGQPQPVTRISVSAKVARASSVVRSSKGWRARISQLSPRRSTVRSEEHTSELQSRENLVCRLLLEKKKKNLY